MPDYNITPESVTVTLDNGDVLTVKKGDPNFNKAKKAALNEDWEALPKLVSKGIAVTDWISAYPDWQFENNQLFYCKQRINDKLNARIVAMVQNGESAEPFMKFWVNLQENPSYRSVEQVYQFLELKGIPIDQDGYIVAYKGVTADLKDCRTQKVDNSPGATPSMARNLVSDLYEVPCHTGYHHGNLSFARSFGSTVVLTRIHPRDVVCVAKDNVEKMRVCAYRVLTVLKNTEKELSSTFVDTTKWLSGEVHKAPKKDKPAKTTKTAKPAKTAKAPKSDKTDYSNMTLKQLRPVALSLGIKGASKMSKEKLLALIDLAQS